MTDKKLTLEFIARGAPAGQAKQLVFLLHGYGRNASLMEKLADEVATRLPDARIIMPQAPEPMRRPDDESANLLKMPQDVREPATDNTAELQWFDIRGQAEDLRKRLIAVAAVMNDFIDNQRDICGLADHDIAVMGFSQGGGVALYSALMRPQAVRCAVGHSTIFLGDTAFRSRPPVLFLYGEADPEFKPAFYAEAARALKDFTGALTVKTVPGLAHTTTRESRTIVADYIAHAFKPRARLTLNY